MAERGNPNPTGSKPDKLMRDAIMVALNRAAKDADGKPTRKMALIADKLVELAIEGDMAAIKEINDRVDGKASQPLVGERDQPIQLMMSARETLERKLNRISQVQAMRSDGEHRTLP